MQRRSIITLLITHSLVAIVAVLLWAGERKIEHRWQLPPAPSAQKSVSQNVAPKVGLERMTDTTNDNLESVIGALEHGDVTQAYLVNAIGIETAVTATPEACVKFAPDKIEYELTPERSARLASLLRQLRTESKPNESGADVRVGLILRGGRSSGWRWTAFTDQFGKYGYLGGHRVATSPALVRFVNRAFANLE